MAERTSRQAKKAPEQGVAAARRKSAAFRAREAAAGRRRRALWWAGSIVAVVISIVVVVAAVRTSKPNHSGTAAGSSGVSTSRATSPMGPEGVALEEGSPLASVPTAVGARTVEGVQCNSMEQAVYHIHAHLGVYVEGALRPVPAGIGVVAPVAKQSPHGFFDEASRCYYWLHTHAQDGIIHVEAPNHATYTLGQFFAIWHQPLGLHQVGPERGDITTFVNGKRYLGDPATIRLSSHEDIQLDVGAPQVPPQDVDWSGAQL